MRLSPLADRLVSAWRLASRVTPPTSPSRVRSTRVGTQPWHMEETDLQCLTNWTEVDNSTITEPSIHLQLYSGTTFFRNDKKLMKS